VQYTFSAGWTSFAPPYSQKSYKNASAETVSMDLNVHWKKVYSKGFQKSYGLNRDWTQVSYSLVLRELHKHHSYYVCGECSSTFSGSSLHQCLQHAVKNEQNNILICHNIIQVARWRACNFAKIPHQYMLWMPRYDELKVWLQRKCVQKYGKKKKIMSPAGFEPATSWMPVRRCTGWVTIFREK